MLWGEVGDISFSTPLLVGTPSEALVSTGCVAFGLAGGKDLRSGFGRVGDRVDVFEVAFPDASAVADLGEEILCWAVGEVGVFCSGLLGFVGDFVETRGRIRPPAGRTDIASLLAMKFPWVGGSFRASFILVANDCEAAVDFAIGFDFVEGLSCGTASAPVVLEGEDSNGEPFSMTPKPPSTSADFLGVASAPPIEAALLVPLVLSSANGCTSGFVGSWS